MMAKNSPVATSSANIVIPRPRSAHTTGTIRLDDYSHQWWMQEYHKNQQQHRKQQLQQQPTAQYKSAQPTPTVSTNTRDTCSSSNTSSNNSYSNSGSKKLKGTNLFLNFNSLKINSYDHNNLNKKTLPCSGTDIKTEHPETLDGYRVYKGSGYLALGLTRHNTTCLDSGSSRGENKSDIRLYHENTPYTPFTLPDKFVLAADKSCSYDNSGSQADQHLHHKHKHQLHPSKQTSPPSHNHLQNQRRTRPLSASSSDPQHQLSIIANNKDKKGVKTKHCVKKVKPTQQTLYRAPTITTIQLQSHDAISLTPRQKGAVLASSQPVTEQTSHAKSEQSHQQPKSILKNNSSEVLITPTQYLQLGIGNHHKTLPMSFQKLKQEYAYQELLVASPSHKTHQTSPGTLTRHGPSGQGQTVHRVTPTVISPKRPKSAAATTTSRFDLLDRSSSPGRKSVTFNSFVSFLSENKIATIRSLPVDV